jgi:transposase
MNEKPLLAPELPIPAEDWDHTPASVREMVHGLWQQVQQLETEVAELKEQLHRNSRNSSQPPSSDGPAQQPSKAEAQVPDQTRRRGGQPGHSGHRRDLVPVAEVDRIEACKPAQCAGCGSALEGEDPAPYRYQTVELPPVKPYTTEYQVHTLTCPCCGRVNRGELPTEAAVSAFGPNLTGLIAILMGVFRLSKRNVVALLAMCYRIRLSPGSVVRVQTSVSAALAEPVEHAREAVQTHAARYIDETGWRQGDQDRHGWLWVVVTPLVSVFTLVLSRAGRVARALLDPDSDGAAITDRAGCYHWLKGRVWQVCWAHLLRDFQKILERGGASYRIGENLRLQGEYLLVLWSHVRDGTLSQADFLAELPAIQHAVRHWLTEGVACTHPQTAETCRRLLDIEAALWTFATHPNVEPTNNTAERALRHAVIWRRTSYGTQSEAGSRFIERILTVVATCRQQGRHPLEFVCQAVRAQRAGLPAPSLLPDTLS